jgi:tellurite resistance protein TerC
MEWILFNFLIAVLLLLDLFVFHRKTREISLKEGLCWSFFWILLALIFNVFIYLSRGEEAAVQFFTGFLIEKSLSVDNLFVFALIFSSFKTSRKEQYRILYWGIIGAFIMRLGFIFAGVALMSRFHEVIYILGVFLIATGIKLLMQRKKHSSMSVGWVRSCLPRASPFILTLIAIEYADLVFALDSLPAIFAITTDRFIIYTSNVFALLGLRSLYFVLAHFMKRFRKLKYALALILIFIGLKMLLSPFYQLNTLIALGVVIALLLLAILK